jgi:hypothetical protein
LGGGIRVAVKRRVWLEFIVVHAFRGLLLEGARKGRGDIALVRRDEEKARSGLLLVDHWKGNKYAGSTKTKDACEVYASPP